MITTNFNIIIHLYREDIITADIDNSDKSITPENVVRIMVRSDRCTLYVKSCLSTSVAFYLL